MIIIISFSDIVPMYETFPIEGGSGNTVITDTLPLKESFRFATDVDMSDFLHVQEAFNPTKWSDTLVLEESFTGILARTLEDDLLIFEQFDIYFGDMERIINETLTITSVFNYIKIRKC